MNVREYATSLYIDLDRFRDRLDDFENSEDFSELVALAQELSADIHTVQQELDSQFDLAMDDENV